MSSAYRRALSAATSTNESRPNKLTTLKSFVKKSIPENLPSTATLSGTISAPTNREGDKQTWKAWAGQKLRDRKCDNGNSGGVIGEERIYLMPGWAVRKYRASTTNGFDIEYYISGFSSIHRPPELATRSQKAFLRMAKGFASLPKLVAEGIAETTSERPPLKLSPSTEKLLGQKVLPPPPSEMTEAQELEALENSLKMVIMRNDFESDSESDIPQSPPSAHPAPPPLPPRPTSFMAEAKTASESAQEMARALHYNLETRLQPFWSTALGQRLIKVHLYTSARPKAGEESPETFLLASQQISTESDGSFLVRGTIRWEELQRHSGGRALIDGDPQMEYDLLAVAEMEPLPPSLVAGSTTTPVAEPATTSIAVPLSHSSIRLISDIDDTVKKSNILHGARAVFYNVFVREMQEAVIPGMAEWYTEMYKRGVRFHYCSNGPLELLPVVMEFLQVSSLPPGSVRLKSYFGRSLFNGLLSAPAARKRSGLLDILNAFPDARFLLVGDTGEQDLELYSQLAGEFPDRVVGIFVRDVGGPHVKETNKEEADSEREIYEGIADPTGQGVLQELTLGGGVGQGAGSILGEGAAVLQSPPEVMWDEDSKNPVPLPTRAVGGGGDHFPDMGVAVPGAGKVNTALNSRQNSAQLTGGMLPMQPLARTSHPHTARENSYKARISAAITSPLHPDRRSSGTSSQSVGYATGGTLSANAPMSETEKYRWELQLRVNRARAAVPRHIPLRVFREPEECVEAWAILDRLNIGIGKESGGNAGKELS